MLVSKAVRSKNWFENSISLNCELQEGIESSVLLKIVNPFVFDKMVTIEGINRPANNPPLRSYDPAIQQDLAYYVHQLRGSNFILQSRLALLKEKAKNTIEFLKKEYHLK